MAQKNLPRGIRNANPGNIELGDPWQGLTDSQTDGRFAQFVNPAYGIRAIARTLITYQDKHGIRTVSGAIHRWAPPIENDTDAYVRAVQRAVGGDLVDMHDYRYLRPLVEAIIRHENGVGPLKNVNTWYDSATIDKGLELAGVRPDNRTVGKVPVTKETVGATATGAIGIAEVADGLPGVVAAIHGADDHLSSGSVVRIVIGLVLVAAAIFIAYGQVKKHQSGAL